MAAKKLAKPPVKLRPSSPPVRTSLFPSTNFFEPAFFQSHRTPVVLLAGIALALYGMTVAFGYLQDDQIVLWDNAFVQKGLKGLREIFSNDSLLGYYKDPKLLYEGGRYRPLPLLTYALEITLFGKNQPGISHAVNVLLYASTGVLLYRILVALFANGTSKVWYAGLPFWATALFLLHPLHTEVVANIKGRDEILALLGSLGALYAAMRFFDSGQNRWLAYSGLALFLGLLSKENTVTFVAVVPLTLWMFSKIPLGRITNVGFVLLGTTILFVLVRYQALGYIVRPENPMKELVLDPFMDMSLGDKFATIFLTLGWYLKLLVFPHPLTIDYYPYHVPQVTWADWRSLLSLAFHLIVGVWAVLLVRSSRTSADPENSVSAKRTLAYAVLFYLLTLSVVSNIFVSTSTFMNERYLYMPSVGFALFFAWLFADRLPVWLENRAEKAKLIGLALLGATAVLFAWRTLVRVPDWGGNGAGLVEKAVQTSKNSYRANYYYGALLYQERFLKQPNASPVERLAWLDESERHLIRSLEINPGYRLAATMKVQVLAAKHKQDGQLAALLGKLDALTKSQPYNGDMLVQLLLVLKSLQGADPNLYNQFCYRLGYDYYYKQKGDLNGGLEFLNLALANFAQDPNTLRGLVEIYTAKGDHPKAAEMQQRLLALPTQ
ncbi:MAG: hypothetical protein ABMA02_08870 [Saprospiraceae bacterium]